MIRNDLFNTAAGLHCRFDLNYVTFDIRSVGFINTGLSG